MSKGKAVKKPKTLPKSRKTIRKEKRLEKKQKKQDYYVNRSKGGKFVLKKNNNVDDTNTNKKQNTDNSKFNKSKKQRKPQPDAYTQGALIDKRRQDKLEKEMKQQRKKQLVAANKEEDKVIKRLEKDLKLNKRKSKAVPKSFEVDGLDYLLEICDAKNIKNVLSSEQQITEGNDDFEEDFALISGKTKNKTIKNNKLSSNLDSNDENENEFFKLTSKSKKNEQSKNNNSQENFSEEDSDAEQPPVKKQKANIGDDNSDITGESSKEYNNHLSDEESSEYEGDEEEPKNNKRKSKSLKTGVNNKQSHKNKLDKKITIKASEESDFDENDNIDDEELSDSENYNDFNSKDDVKQNSNIKNKGKKLQKIQLIEGKIGSKNKNKDIESDNEDEISSSEDELNSNSEEESKSSDNEETWEDIYGRKRAKDGQIIPVAQKYIPPALRNQTDTKRSEKLMRLKKQLKGLLNRLAESNMHSIASQIEELYMNNSRNDMNETLTQLIFESLISFVHTPERLLLEHVMLITILHANVGTEVGATFLLNVIKKFEELLKMNQEVENKELDNAVHIIAQLYNFKVFHAQLLYEIIAKLANKFEEKHVECILLVLKNVGFSLRKDDPIPLKQIILDLQKRAATVPEDNSRVKFMRDILLAIKNNNVTKIPNYDTTYSEHLKKLIKGFIRKGNYVTQLNISLEDLLKADERGKWWVVGSAWSGMEEKKESKEEGKTPIPVYSKKLLELAKKQRMNTDTRRNIFCIIMTAEDYLDAFEKLLHLGLKNQQEREIVHVILHCCLQENNFNPYYAVLIQKFCEYDRKFQMIVRCSIWDKLKALTDCSGSQLANIAKLLAHLFIQQGLPISILKVIEFGELDKITLRFMRQVLLSVLLHEDEEACLTVFKRVATTPKLKMFRDSLRLFIHHFLLRNLKDGIVEEEQKTLLTNRAQQIEKALVSSEYKSELS